MTAPRRRGLVALTRAAEHDLVPGRDGRSPALGVLLGRRTLPGRLVLGHSDSVRARPGLGSGSGAAFAAAGSGCAAAAAGTAGALAAAACAAGVAAGVSVGALTGPVDATLADSAAVAGAGACAAVRPAPVPTARCAPVADAAAAQARPAQQTRLWQETRPGPGGPLPPETRPLSASTAPRRVPVRPAGSAADATRAIASRALDVWAARASATASEPGRGAPLRVGRSRRCRCRAIDLRRGRRCGRGGLSWRLRRVSGYRRSRDGLRLNRGCRPRCGPTAFRPDAALGRRRTAAAAEAAAGQAAPARQRPTPKKPARPAQAQAARRGTRAPAPRTRPDAGGQPAPAPRGRQRQRWRRARRRRTPAPSPARSPRAARHRTPGGRTPAGRRRGNRCGRGTKAAAAPG